MGLAVGVEEGQAVETLVVLREATEAEEESADTHFHQHSPLVAEICGQGLGHLDHLNWGLWLPLSLTGRGLRSSRLRGGWLWRGGWDSRGLRARFHRDLGLWSLRERHHHSFYYFLDNLFFRLDARMFSM